MISIFIRIALRYIAAFLMAHGLLSDDIGYTLSSDDDVIQVIELALGSLVGIAAEIWLYAEQKFGWK